MALYDQNGMMQAERLRQLIARFKDKPEIVASLQRQLDQLLGSQAVSNALGGRAYDSEPDRYAADQGWFDAPVGYAPRTGNADGYRVNPNSTLGRFAARRGMRFANNEAYDARQAEIERQRMIAAQQAAYGVRPEDYYRDSRRGVYGDNVIVGGGRDAADVREGSYIYVDKNPTATVDTSNGRIATGAGERPSQNTNTVYPENPQPRTGYKKLSLNPAEVYTGGMGFPDLNFGFNVSTQGGLISRANAGRRGITLNQSELGNQDGLQIVFTPDRNPIEMPSEFAGEDASGTSGLNNGDHSFSYYYADRAAKRQRRER